MGKHNFWFRLLSLFMLFSSSTIQASVVEKPGIYFVVILRYNPMIVYQKYQPVMDYLIQSTPFRFELKLARDYPEAME